MAFRRQEWEFNDKVCIRPDQYKRNLRTQPLVLGAREVQPAQSPHGRSSLLKAVLLVLEKFLLHIEGDSPKRFHSCLIKLAAVTDRSGPWAYILNWRARGAL